MLVSILDVIIQRFGDFIFSIDVYCSYGTVDCLGCLVKIKCFKLLVRIYKYLTSTTYL